ncbi:hypothetical protein [Desulfuromonas sp. AOP6]|uniref:hypothetical protein n=1 Tax=Desulfuromonas sp. AOP6 TaxID=1566351 RepID=UPI0012815768|nr:hypothetical protein [Desulfuromonas sp. AOP6]BCA79823.1 hypothetical protein AOP6_1610 [Desulfuromonas sp. AOP6]
MPFLDSGFLNAQLAMGIFSLYVFVVSAFRLMADDEFPRLTAMKRSWGRIPGLVMHFVSNVGLPMVLGIVFLCQGIVGFGQKGLESGRRGVALDLNYLLVSSVRDFPPPDFLLLDPRLNALALSSLAEFNPSILLHWASLCP